MAVYGQDPSPRQLKLLDNQAASGAPAYWPGGEATFHVVGNFNGATVSLRRLGPDGATWTDVATEAVLTQPGLVTVRLGAGEVMVNVAGGAPSGLYAELARIL